MTFLFLAFGFVLGTPSGAPSIPLPDKKILQLILDKLQKYGASDFPFLNWVGFFHCLLEGSELPPDVAIVYLVKS